MDLQPINPPLRNGQHVLCVHCRERITNGGYADLEGGPYNDYYCNRCARSMAYVDADGNIRHRKAAG